MPDFFAYDEARDVATRTLRFSFGLIGAINGILASGVENRQALAFRGVGMWVGNERGAERFPLLFADPGVLENGDFDGPPIPKQEFATVEAILNDLGIYQPPDLRVAPLGPVEAHVGPGDPVTGTAIGRLGVCFDVGGNLRVSTAGHCAGGKGTHVALGGASVRVVDDWNPLAGSLPHAGGCLSTSHFLDLATLDPGPTYSQQVSRFAFTVGGNGPPPGDLVGRFDGNGVNPVAAPVNSLAHWVIVAKPHAGLWSCCYVTNGAIGSAGDSGAPVVWDDSGSYELVGHYLGGDSIGRRSFVQGIDFQLTEMAKLTGQSVSVVP